MKHEETLKRENGDRVKISVTLRVDFYTETANYEIGVFIAKAGKRKFEAVPLNERGLNFRSLSMEDRRAVVEFGYRDYVTEAEIKAAQLALWEKAKPKPEKLRVKEFQQLITGEKFRFATDAKTRVRAALQIGKTEIYCPHEASPDHDSNEVYRKGNSLVFLILDVRQAKTPFTKLRKCKPNFSKPRTRIA